MEYKILQIVHISQFAKIRIDIFVKLALSWTVTLKLMKRQIMLKCVKPMT